jgi:hypothetical protein
MSGPENRKTDHLTCAECRERLPLYLEEGLQKTESLRVFLHARGCAACAAELAAQEALTELLRSLPQRRPPADFDAKILAAVPYGAYRAMAGLRRPRVPVLLETESLPAWLRSPAIRATGAIIAAGVVAARLAGLLPETALLAAAVGLLPEVVLRLQALGRRLVLGRGQVRKGA